MTCLTWDPKEEIQIGPIILLPTVAAVSTCGLPQSNLPKKSPKLLSISVSRDKS